MRPLVLFLEIDDLGLFAGRVDQHESATANARAGGIDDAQGERGRTGGVDSIAAGLEDFQPGERGQRVIGSDHAVFSCNGAPSGGVAGMQPADREGDDDRTEQMTRCNHGRFRFCSEPWLPSGGCQGSTLYRVETAL